MMWKIGSIIVIFSFYENQAIIADSKDEFLQEQHGWVVLREEGCLLRDCSKHNEIGGAIQER